MAHRINERNTGNFTLDASPKKRGKKLTLEEWAIILYIADKVYDAMESDEITGRYVDEGRIVLSLSGEQMYDLFEAKRKLHEQMTNQMVITN
jgi:hypothetical protein